MHGDTALDAAYRHSLMPDSSLQGEANLLVLPDSDLIFASGFEP